MKLLDVLMKTLFTISGFLPSLKMLNKRCFCGNEQSCLPALLNLHNFLNAQLGYFSIFKFSLFLINLLTFATNFNATFDSPNSHYWHL